MWAISRLTSTSSEALRYRPTRRNAEPKSSPTHSELRSMWTLFSNCICVRAWERSPASSFEVTCGVLRPCFCFFRWRNVRPLSNHKTEYRAFPAVCKCPLRTKILWRSMGTLREIKCSWKFDRKSEGKRVHITRRNRQTTYLVVNFVLLSSLRTQIRMIHRVSFL
jgi:hypothetical protein